MVFLSSEQEMNI